MSSQRLLSQPYKANIMNQLSSQELFTETELDSDKVLIFDARCIICNKQFNSMRGISMHLKMTGARHSVIFNSYGNYDKRTGFKEMNRP
jgi:hypothetical protein